MKMFLLFFVFALQGCLIVVDEDCDTNHPDYEYTETDCYYTIDTVRVCNRHYCWNETRDVHVCEEYHVCRESVWVVR